MRQRDLGRLVALAEELAELDGPAFVAELERRFGDGGESRRGVHLLTLHGAKGLEFDAVFVAHVEGRELPARQAKTEAAVTEERRLLYVGLTRARRHLWVTWSTAPVAVPRGARASRIRRRRARRQSPSRPTPCTRRSSAGVSSARRRTAVPAYVVFHNSTLAEVAARRPKTLNELASVPGVGPTKLERYGEDVLAALSAA